MLQQYRSPKLIIGYWWFLPEQELRHGRILAEEGSQRAVTFRGRYRNAGSFEMRSCTCSPCNLCDFLLHPLYVYMPKDRVPFLPYPFPVHRVCSLILLTGLANDPYLVHRKIMKLREKETRHYVGSCFVSTYTSAIVCRIEAVKLVPVESHFRLKEYKKI